MITWRCKKQEVAARSSVEAEFGAIAHGICELLWVKMILKVLWLMPSWHFIKEKLDDSDICTLFVKTGEQLADILTKGVSSRIFHTILSKLGICNIYASA